MTRFERAEDINRLCNSRIPESGSLEYKRELKLKTPSQRREALKDLTGMANGGGGTVLYGVAETTEPESPPVAGEIKPLVDASVVGRLEDIVRSGVRPPLLMDCAVIEVDGGMVLAVDVDPSPLGPYMVEPYSDGRYYHRSLTRTVPMSEQQVRDAYALATRGREHRAQLWAERGLPLAVPSSSPWLSLSALPEEPLDEILDLTFIRPAAVQPPQAIANHLRFMGAMGQLSLWAQGYFGDDASDGEHFTEIVRLHRDGAGTLGIELDGPLSLICVARCVNGMLAYLAWLWKEFGLRRPVEIEITLHNLNRATLATESLVHQGRMVAQPPGVAVHQVARREPVLVPEVNRASVRHQVVQRFTDRLGQAFGQASCKPLFRSGQLYGHDGKPLHLSVAGHGLWRESQTTPQAIVYDDDSIRRMEDDSHVIGHLREGAIIDTSGNILAVIEMASATACPDDFLPTSLVSDPRARAPQTTQPHEAHTTYAPPHPTGHWSAEQLPSLL